MAKTAKYNEVPYESDRDRFVEYLRTVQNGTVKAWMIGRALSRNSTAVDRVINGMQRDKIIRLENGYIWLM